MRKQRKSAFTLIELLVVIVIIGILMSILLPGVMNARESARRIECANNQKQIGLAIHGYATSKNSDLPANIVPEDGGDKPYYGWNCQILPYLEEAKINAEYDISENWWDDENSNNRLVTEIRVPMFVCPTGPHPNRWLYMEDYEGDLFQMAPTDYVASSGIYYMNNVPENLYRGAMASPGRYYGGSGVTAGEAVNLSEIRDGTSSTILVVEMADKPNVWRGGKMTESNMNSEDPYSIVPSYSFGAWGTPNWNHLRSWDYSGTVSFGPCAVNCSNQASIYGFHPNGANVLMCDGSVKFVQEGLSQELFVAMVSIADNEIVSDGEIVVFPDLDDNN